MQTVASALAFSTSISMLPVVFARQEVPQVRRSGVNDTDAGIAMTCLQCFNTQVLRCWLVPPGLSLPSSSMMMPRLLQAPYLKPLQISPSICTPRKERCGSTTGPGNPPDTAHPERAGQVTAATQQGGLCHLRCTHRSGEPCLLPSWHGTRLCWQTGRAALNETT
jgi:hypothetical protein